MKVPDRSIKQCQLLITIIAFFCCYMVSVSYCMLFCNCAFYQRYFTVYASGWPIHFPEQLQQMWDSVVSRPVHYVAHLTYAPPMSRRVVVAPSFENTWVSLGLPKGRLKLMVVKALKGGSDTGDVFIIGPASVHKHVLVTTLKAVPCCKHSLRVLTNAWLSLLGNKNICPCEY